MSENRVILDTAIMSGVAIEERARYEPNHGSKIEVWTKLLMWRTIPIQVSNSSGLVHFSTAYAVLKSNMYQSVCLYSSTLYDEKHLTMSTPKYVRWSQEQMMWLWPRFHRVRQPSLLNTDKSNKHTSRQMYQLTFELHQVTVLVVSETLKPRWMMNVKLTLTK